jgi:hypothetical protein
MRLRTNDQDGYTTAQNGKRDGKRDRGEGGRRNPREPDLPRGDEVLLDDAADLVPELRNQPTRGGRAASGARQRPTRAGRTPSSPSSPPGPSRGPPPRTAGTAPPPPPRPARRRRRGRRGRGGGRSRSRRGTCPARERVSPCASHSIAWQPGPRAGGGGAGTGEGLALSTGVWPAPARGRASEQEDMRRLALGWGKKGREGCVSLGRVPALFVQSLREGPTPALGWGAQSQWDRRLHATCRFLPFPKACYACAVAVG